MIFAKKKKKNHCQMKMHVCMYTKRGVWVNNVFQFPVELEVSKRKKEKMKQRYIKDRYRNACQDRNGIYEAAFACVSISCSGLHIKKRVELKRGNYKNVQKDIENLRGEFGKIIGVWSAEKYRMRYTCDCSGNVHI